MEGSDGNEKIKIRELTDEQLRGIIQFDCATSPYIPIDEINDYLSSMTKEEKEWDEFVWPVVDELVERRKKNSS